jgi:hypothetical protein
MQTNFRAEEVESESKASNILLLMPAMPRKSDLFDSRAYR